jgi:hypothetical protein
MSMSLRSHLVAGVAAVATTALIASPTTVQTYPSALANEPVVTARVDLAASVKPIVLEPLRPEQVATARAVISRIDPESTFAAAAVAAPQNSASDWVTGAYQWLQYWVNYGIELADYVLQFLPFGYFIADQVNIFYDYLITPIADSVVYGLIVPVLNDPLNLTTWVDGLVNVGQTSVTAAINTGIAEFNYFFGWLIPPLPPRPIPPLPLAEVQTVQTLESVEDASLLSVAVEEVIDEKVADAEIVDVVAHGVVAPEVVAPEVPIVVAPEVETPEAPEVVTPEVVTPEVPEVGEDTIVSATPVKVTPTRLTPIKSTLGAVSAQGEVRNGTTTTPATDTKPADDAVKDDAVKDDAVKDNDKPAAPTTSGAGVDQTGATGTPDKTDSTTHTGKPEKKDASTD